MNVKPFPFFYAMLLLVAVLLLSACRQEERRAVDRLNGQSYAWHYRNLDSTAAYARRALAAADGYSGGRAEATNNLAFVDMAKMRYDAAEQRLQAVGDMTDDELELLVADVQLMRLCQRRSRNKDFYQYMASARRRLNRIREESRRLDDRSRRRLTYAATELEITASTYYYYLGLTQRSAAAVDSIDAGGPVLRDTAQLCNYYYTIGSGGILTGGRAVDVAQEEFDYLVRCYFLAVKAGYPYWEAQALQAMSEHLQAGDRQRARLLRDNAFYIHYINVDAMPDSLLAGNLAQRALDLFRTYGDVYQTAGGYRTLAECYWQLHDYASAMACLQRALKADTAIRQAPDLVASIHEQLCLVYSAVDDKQQSDYHRNLYLDLQEQTRQDRYYEARAAQLARSSRQLNGLLIAVALMIAAVAALLFFFDRMRRRSDRRFSLAGLLEPLSRWQERQSGEERRAAARFDALEEERLAGRQRLRQGLARNLEQRAKAALVCGILPLIDRIVNELSRLCSRRENAAQRRRRLDYITELTDTIIADNNVLTRWIEMRRGQVGLRIETFALGELFDIAARGRTGFSLCGITLDVKPTQAVVKADKALTLFMISTITANARRFTPEGGTVTIEARERPDSVEISVSDTGCGMQPEQTAHLFDRTYTGGHGFGLKNCNGIIESYRKLSAFFSVCSIGAESTPGRGSRVFFTLPRGMARAVMAWAAWAVLLLGCPSGGAAATAGHAAQASTHAARFADSAYYSNIAGTYSRTLDFADSCRRYLAPTDTAALLTMSNEAAVAALALHRWELYHEYNKVYTRLFRQASADSTLPDYVQRMQRSQNNKNVAVILLLLLLVSLPPAYYLLYYRHLLNYRYAIDRIEAINGLLSSDLSDEEKLSAVERLAGLPAPPLPAARQRAVDDIIAAISLALRRNIGRKARLRDRLEQAEDELRRIRREADGYHVANSVLDNCLSTIKHETLYYPSRIRQLAETAVREEEGGAAAPGRTSSAAVRSADTLASLRELTGYYRTLYGVLTEQLLSRLTPLSFKAGLEDELADLLTRLNGRRPPVVAEERLTGPYVVLRVELTEVRLTPGERHRLFTPQTTDTGYLVCRQILREMGETTHLMGCGVGVDIAPDAAEDGQAAPAVLRLVMPAVLHHRAAPPAAAE